MKKIALAFICIFSLNFFLSSFFVPVSVASKLSSHHISPRGDFATDEVIVKYKHQRGISNVSVDSIKTIDETLTELKNDPSVEYAEPDYVRDVVAISTNDTDRALLWGLDNTGQAINGDFGNITGTVDADIDAPEAWNINEGTNADVIVAVIDVGVLYTHPDLSANMWDGSSCVDENGDALGNCNHGYNYATSNNALKKSPLPSGSEHGTHVSGIIGAVKNNSAGVIGLAPHSKIMAMKFGLTVSSEVKAIDFAIQNGAKIINASFGGPDFSEAEYDAILRFQNAGGIFVAAAGNCGGSDFALQGCDSENEPLYPANYDLPSIISVAATDQNDALAEFSSYDATAVDVGAPGENILSTVLSNNYGYSSGTSMAAPYTAGLAALIWGYKSNLTAAEVKTAIMTGDADLTLAGKTVSGKRINAQRALFNADISYTQEIHDGATEGTDSGDYGVGSKATLQTAIDSATGVKDNSGSSEADIATAVSNLDSAGATFLATLVPTPDTTAPVITILGGSSVNVKYKATYTDAGATALDDVDGDITSDIVVVNPVNTHNTGTYTITYNVSDAAGNPAVEVTRTVIVAGSSSHGGGGGGGGGGGSKTTKPVAPIVPTDCAPAFLFSPSTGAPCPVSNPADPNRYLLNQTQTNTTPYIYTRTLKFGMMGDEIKTLQNILGLLPADGIFGPHTKAAVIFFQVAHGLTPDGVVGSKTAVLLH